MLHQYLTPLATPLGVSLRAVPHYAGVGHSTHMQPNKPGVHGLPSDNGEEDCRILSLCHHAFVPVVVKLVSKTLVVASLFLFTPGVPDKVQFFYCLVAVRTSIGFNFFPQPATSTLTSKQRSERLDIIFLTCYTTNNHKQSKTPVASARPSCSELRTSTC